ncbi:MAG: hypothetical protein AABX24_02390, partial [Nanoarchaeota archaeon]
MAWGELDRGFYTNLERKLISAQVIEEVVTNGLGYVNSFYSKPHLKQEDDLDLQIHLGRMEMEKRSESNNSFFWRHDNSSWWLSTLEWM